MRAISLHQPHASLIAHGYKPFETRHWPTAYRGSLLIHAARRPMSKQEKDFAQNIFGKEIQIPLGAYVCIVGLEDCLPVENLSKDQIHRSNGLGNFAPGRYAWKLGYINRLKQPIPAIGRQKFWYVHLDVLKVQQGLEKVPWKPLPPPAQAVKMKTK